ncbi:MAG: SEC-C domain-containing protein [Alphaproteobacteria bacterium]|nr:SEC-C domain-containing protein [Alphaproteobacteria bacterium]MCB9792295.1 SEC-C domain-containing protein [Alphaproteobacteria bacterium]
MARVSKNGPCPCGSGKRYKSCCLKADQEGRRQRVSEAKAQERSRTHVRALDQRRQALATEILAWSVRQDGQLAAPPFDLHKHRDAVPLIGEWGAYDSDRPGRFLASEAGAALSPADRALIEEAAQGLTALWEVTAVQPGQGLTLRERFTGLTREVLEPDLSDDVGVGRWIIGRVASSEGVYTLTPFPHLFTPEGAGHSANAMLKVAYPALAPAAAPGLSEAQLRDPKLSFALLWIAGQVGDGIQEARVDYAEALAATLRPTGLEL